MCGNGESAALVVEDRQVVGDRHVVLVPFGSK